MGTNDSLKHLLIAGLFLAAGVGTWWMIQGSKRQPLPKLPGRPSAIAPAQEPKPARRKTDRELQQEAEAADRECVRIFRGAMVEAVRLQRAQADAAAALSREGPLAVPDTSDGRWALAKMNQVVDTRPWEEYVVELEASKSAAVIGNLLGSLRGQIEKSREMEFNFARVAEQVPTAAGDDASRRRLRQVVQGNVEVQRKLQTLFLEAHERIGKL